MRRLLRKTLATAALSLLLVFVLVAMGAWWTYPKRSVDGPFVARAPFTFDDIPRGRVLSKDEIDAFAHRLLREMTLEEKVLQMSGDTWLWDFPGKRFVGREWKAGVDRRLDLPRIVSTDGPRGVGMGFSTCFPVPMARGASWDRSLEERIGDATGQEARAQGANLWLAPCLNLLRHPLWGRAQETYGEDPYLLGEMAAAATVGAQRNNVMACAKHYALNSIEETRDVVDVRVDERVLREVYLPAFKRVVDAGVASVMSAYNRVNGDYCAENHHLLREILKEEWGFEGFVVSDWFQTGQDGVKSIRAGLDLEMPMTAVYGRKLLSAVQGGQVPPGLVDDAVLRMLRRRIEYATRPDPRSYGPGLVGSPDHVALAREAAEKGVVLLRNESSLLPLDARTLKSIAVVGPLAATPAIGDHGSSRVRPPHVVTLLQGLRDRLGRDRVRFEPGTEERGDAPGQSLVRARDAARRAEAAVVVAGFDYPDEGEYNPIPLTDRRDWGGDRKRLALKPEDQQRIVAVAAANPRTIVILIGGAAITVEEWREKVGAILMAFYPGEEGGAAIARVLCGDVNPGGKLPFTVPKDQSQLPAFDDTSRAVDYGRYHGYTLADREGFEPRYPFGYGLSYTTFEYAHLSLDASEVRQGGIVGSSVEVTNTGGRPGEEVVELYVGVPGSRVERPVKLLRGFERVALAPGETKRVSLPLKAADLAFYDPTAARWIVEATEYAVYVGPSSRSKDLLAATLRVVD
jgi:beta-glucosidase